MAGRPRRRPSRRRGVQPGGRCVASDRPRAADERSHGVGVVGEGDARVGVAPWRHVRVRRRLRSGCGLVAHAAPSSTSINEGNAVWTGTEMMVFGAGLGGGNRSTSDFAVGTTYDPSPDAW